MTTTFAAATPNLSINGLAPNPSFLSPNTQTAARAAPDVQEEYTPYDAALEARATSLLAQEDALILEIAELKRQAPAEVAEQWRRQFEESGISAEANVVEQAEGEGLRVQALERQADVEAAWGRAVGGLEVLKGGMGASVARAEKARGVGDYVHGKR